MVNREEAEYMGGYPVFADKEGGEINTTDAKLIMQFELGLITQWTDT